MNENEYLATAITAQLEKCLPAVLISIMNIRGSTPRHEGTKMVVDSNGKAYGTIGGSLIEATALQISTKVFNDKKSATFSFELNAKDATAPGMICGGTAEILLDYFPPSAENLTFSRYWLDAAREGRDFYLLTHFKGKNETFQVLGHAVIKTDKNSFFTTSLTAEDINRLKDDLHTISSSAVLTLDDTQVLIDRIRKLKTLYCFGAGHVAVPTAHLAALAGFRVIVLDDRPEYASPERFPDAYRTIVINDYRQAFQGLEIDEDSYIVIVTPGHKYDREVLEQSLKTSAGYIGMIGSLRKRAAIYEALMARGVKRERLGQVHCPIGINIGGETPEEIAVSIVAELIQTRSQQSK